MTLKDQLLELSIEIAARMSSQSTAVANARSATTALSRARVERDSVDLFLSELADLDEPSEHPDGERESRASGT